MFREALPDLVTLDIMMPDMSGIDVLRRIRESDIETKVVVVTAHADGDLVRQAARIGVDDFLIKPIDPERIVESVGRLLAPPSDG